MNGTLRVENGKQLLIVYVMKTGEGEKIVGRVV